VSPHEQARELADEFVGTLARDLVLTPAEWDLIHNAAVNWFERLLEEHGDGD
jgi:hypothetical protein